jgi:hypothetical protein
MGNELIGDKSLLANASTDDANEVRESPRRWLPIALRATLYFMCFCTPR